MLGGIAAAYVFSPVQLIPNFIPFVGYLDDFLVVTLCGWLALKLTPPGLIAELRTKAEAITERPVSRVAALLILLIWMTVSVFGAAMAWGLIRSKLLGDG